MSSTLSPETLADLRFPQDVRVSPDGRLVAFVVDPVGRPHEHAQSAIWLAPTDGSALARQVTAGTAEDTSPLWAPDSRALFFRSDREEHGCSQLYVLALDGGEARRLTDGKPGVGAHAPLPDGRRVLVLSSDARPRRTSAGSASGTTPRCSATGGPNVPGCSTSRPESSGRSSAPASVTSPTSRRHPRARSWPPCFGTRGDRQPGAGGGARAARRRRRSHRPFVARARRRRRARLERRREDVFVLAPAEPGGQSGEALFSIGVDADELVPLTAELPACPTAVATARRPLVAVAEGLDSYVARVEDGALVRLSDVPGSLRWLSASADGAVAAAVRGGPDGPFEVWAGPPDGEWASVSDLNPTLAGATWAARERLAWNARDGLPLDGLLLLPHGKTRADGPFPLVTLVHGGPYGRFGDDLQVHWAVPGELLAAAGYAVYLPNPRGGMGHGQRFAAVVRGAVGRDDWADVESGLDELVAAGVADPDRLAEGPGPHPHDALSPISYVARVRTPTLILHGERDERVPASQGRFFARALRAAGVPFELVIYPREPHGVRERNHVVDVGRRWLAWLERWVRPGG